jgi:hypothetical protein
MSTDVNVKVIVGVKIEKRREQILVPQFDPGTGAPANPKPKEFVKYFSEGVELTSVFDELKNRNLIHYNLYDRWNIGIFGVEVVGLSVFEENLASIQLSVLDEKTDLARAVIQQQGINTEPTLFVQAQYNL